MKENEAYDFSGLILRYLKRELSEDEERAFLDAVSKNPVMRKVLESYKGREELDDALRYQEAIDMDQAWQRVLSKKSMHDTQPNTKGGFNYLTLKRWLPYAAILLILLAAGFWRIIYTHDELLVEDKQYGFANDVLAAPNSATLVLSNGDEVALDAKNTEVKYDGTARETSEGFNEVRVANTGKFKIRLSDGSTVWLSSSSKLRYPVAFHGSERRVSLEGEAYFDIAKDAQKPFYVEVGGKEIRVLGTQFNVSAYTPEVRTTLIEGSVRIEDGAEINVLKPGQQAVFRAGAVLIQPANIEREIAWKKGYFSFDRDPMESIMEEIARWYNVTVAYEGTLKNDVYTGSVPRAATLGGVLQALTDVSGLRFTIEGRKVTVIKQ
ncbi:FecR family protein [Pedobacter deserti]|uniref:FecR family protein n=1 Tax=Pedobacter deserti TaxID=2817382 RepID=UPI00210A227C|nr:FecR domain-containing protein [Pedobacter sp. SYSU D00382]